MVNAIENFRCICITRIQQVKVARKALYGLVTGVFHRTWNVFGLDEEIRDEGVAETVAGEPVDVTLESVGKTPWTAAELW